VIASATAGWFGWAPTSEEELRRTWSAPGGTFLVAGRADGLAGYAALQAGGPEHTVLWLDVRVPPGADEHEVAAALVDASEPRAAGLAGRAEAGTRVVLRTHAAEGQTELERVLAARGYRPVRRAALMALELDRPPDEPEWPEGTRPRLFAPGRDEHAVYELSMEALADTWEFVPQTYRSWAAASLESPEFDPTLWFLAEADGEIAGAMLCHYSAADPALGWLELIAVRRRWRRRRLGLALFLQALGEFRARGATRVGLGVDPDNPTGAARLAEAGGFRPARRFTTYEKELRPDRPLVARLARSTRPLRRRLRR
jgi:ribosomal protein S18 acetylase RimI-like enzyme